MKRLPGECRVKLVITGKPLSAQYGNLLKLQADEKSGGYTVTAVE